MYKFMKKLLFVFSIIILFAGCNPGESEYKKKAIKTIVDVNTKCVPKVTVISAVSNQYIYRMDCKNRTYILKCYLLSGCYKLLACEVLTSLDRWDNPQQERNR